MGKSGRSGSITTPTERTGATGGNYSVMPRFFANLSLTDNISFKDYREKNKISNLAAFFLVFKSCVGLGVFSYPYAFANCGYVYGTILCFIATYMTGYGMWTLSDLASRIEKTKFGLKKMHNYNGKNKKFYLKKLTIFSFGKTFDRKSVQEEKLWKFSRGHDHHRLLFDQFQCSGWRHY
jgi:hypothetical protein